MNSATKTPTEPYLFLREKRLISLLESLGKSVPEDEFQALLFLQFKYLKKHFKSSVSSVYDFVPTVGGPYSFTSYHDRLRLIERGILEPTTSKWQLTEFGSGIATEFVETKTTECLKDRAHVRGEALFTEICIRHPSYIIKKWPSTSVDKTKNRPVAQKFGGLYTIGYERRSLEEFLNLLINYQIDVLCDVRRNAISRRFGFSKKVLQSSCQKIGIEYQHLPCLGIESTSRRDLSTQAQRKKLFAMYAKESSEQKSQAIAEIKSELMMGKRVALTCYERDVEDCHRGVLATQLVDEVVLADLNATDRMTYQCNLTHL